ncbi:MAG TPA: hypothetical protein PKJ97_03460, partial [Candidatus Bilamarchaeaceae archaeon]|nr:hypothetical protein [Candidatus Bilamarchaeaceae archaeon]
AGRLDHMRQYVRGVGDVRIHLDEQIVGALQTPGEPGEVGLAQALFGFPVEDMDALVKRMM